MSTRALIFLQDDAKRHLATVYHHSDGYPDYLGRVLGKLADRKIVNGIGCEYTSETHANGFEELAINIVCALKQTCQTGGVYLSSIVPDHPDASYAGIEFAYVVGPGPDGQPQVECYSTSRTNWRSHQLFVLAPSAIDAWLTENGE
jgi:hypothetical protein